MAIPRWVLVCATLAVGSTPTQAQWTIDPGPVGRLVFSSTALEHSSAPDGSGGVYVGYRQKVVENATGSFVQHIDARGNLPWGASGVQLASFYTFDSYLWSPKLGADGVGGVFVLSYDFPGSSIDLVVRHLGADGTSQWPVGQVYLASLSTAQSWWVESDGSGGCLATWRSSGTPPRYRAQKIDAAGTPLWGTNGIDLGFATNTNANFTTDGTGGLIVAWSEVGTQGADVYAQRFGADGSALWTAGGVALTAIAGDQGTGSWPIAPVGDGAGGATVVWQDYRNDPAGDLYAQRVSGSGSVMWAANGVPLCIVDGTQQLDYRAAVTDGVGGLCVAWEDSRKHNAGIDVYAQRVDGTGAVRWGSDGLPLTTALNHQINVRVVSDGGGGIIASWTDERNDPPNGYDIYVQHVDGQGITRGQVSGTLVGSSPPDGLDASTVELDGAGGATVVWTDNSQGRARNIPAASIQLGVDDGSVSLAPLKCFPNPARGSSTVSFSLPRPGSVRVEVVDLAGRRVWSRERGELGSGTHEVKIAGLPAGLYLIRIADRERTARGKLVFLP